MRISKFKLIPAVGLALCASASGQQQAWYVDAAAPPNGDGTTWATAFQDLESALQQAAFGINGIQEVAVKEGTYSPNGFQTFNGFATFLMNADDVHVHGGFLGLSDDPHAPDGDPKNTVLTGNDETNHVFVVDGVERVEIAGFKIQDSVADGSFFPEDSGAAIYCNSSVELFVENMTFRDNTADEAGGAVYYANSGDFDCRNSLFRGNVARQGGAFYMRFFSETARFSNVVFRNNGTTGLTDHGGAMFVDTDTRVKASNCVFFDNAARSGGAVYHDISDYPGSLDDHSYRHSTFAFNTVPGTSQGSEIHVATGHPSGRVDFYNSIAYNPDGSGGPDIRAQGVPMMTMATVNVDYSNVLESNPALTGPGMISQDPLFKNPTNRNLRLKINSPCKDAGSNALRGSDFLDIDDDGNSSENLSLDKDLENRLILNVVDMGAYEYRPSYIPPKR